MPPPLQSPGAGIRLKVAGRLANLRRGAGSPRGNDRMAEQRATVAGTDRLPALQAQSEAIGRATRDDAARSPSALEAVLARISAEVTAEATDARKRGKQRD